MKKRGLITKSFGFWENREKLTSQKSDSKLKAGNFSRVLTFLILIIYILLIVNLTYAQYPITGEAIITGKATKDFSVSVSVIVGSPSCSITSLQNTTYLYSDNILLNFTSNATESIWFNINNGVNITINSSTHFCQWW